MRITGKSRKQVEEVLRKMSAMPEVQKAIHEKREG